MSKRGDQWTQFAYDEVYKHIEDYTVPQYGDMPHDQVSEFTVEDFKTNLKRYVNRIGVGARGKKEALRDCLKIAHYACLLYFKLKEEPTGLCRVCGKNPPHIDGECVDCCH